MLHAPDAATAPLMFGRRRRRDRSRAASDSELHVCRECGAPFVIPVVWSALGESRWLIALRCGECESAREVIVANHVAERYDEDLGRATAIIRRAVERLDRERLAREADAFATALRRDLIDAGDFGG